MFIELRNKFGEEKGSALFSIIMLVIVVFAVGMAVLDLTQTEARISFNQQQATKALFLAEAGIQLAIHQLELDPQWKAGYRNYPLGEGVIKEVTVENKLNNVRIESQGEVQGVGRRIRAELIKRQVPFTYPLITHNLVLRPGSNLRIEGDALHYGDFALTTPGELEGFFIVDGSVHLDKAAVQGTISATGPITVGDSTHLKAMLVSARSIEFTDELPEGSQSYSSVPVLVPKAPPKPDFNWYHQKPHLLIEEPVLFVEDLFSGIYVAAGDLTIMDGGEGIRFPGQTAVVVPGTARISSNLVTDDAHSSIFVIAEDIIVEPGVTEVWGALFASDSIQVMGGSLNREFYGTLQAPLISLPPGTTRLVYFPLEGNHLVKEPQVLFQITDWLEIVHW